MCQILNYFHTKKYYLLKATLSLFHLLLHFGAQSQIRELDVSVPVQQDIVGLQVAVDVPQLVHL